MQLRPVSPAGVLWVGEAFVTFCGSYWKTSLVKFCFTGEEKASYRKHDICVGISEREKKIFAGNSMNLLCLNLQTQKNKRFISVSWCFHKHYIHLSQINNLIKYMGHTLRSNSCY